MSKPASIVESVGFHVLVLCAALGPVPFGSNSPALAGFLGLLLTLSLCGSLVVAVPSGRVRRLYVTAALLCILVVLYSAAQIALLQGNSWANPIWSHASRLIDAPGIISVSRYQPLHSMGYVLLAIVAFMSALVYVRETHRCMRLLHLLLGAGCIVAVFSIGQYILAPSALLWGEKRHYIGVFTGTFVNPNTAATYFGLMLLVSLSVCLQELQRSKLLGSLWGRDLSRADTEHVRLLAVYSALVLTFLVALLLTQSRAGILSSLVGVVSFCCAFIFFAVRGKATTPVVAGLTALPVVAAALSISFYGGRLIRRVQLDGLVDEARICTYASTWRAIKDNFWLGTGLGTFEDIFPSYRMPDCSLYGHWNAAHDVFLEGWLALGVVFLACTAVVYYQLIRTYVQGLRDRRRMRFMPLGSLCALLLVSLHSLVDFSVQTPAVAVLVAVLLGSGAAVSLGRAREGPAAEGARSALSPRGLPPVHQPHRPVGA